MKNVFIILGLLMISTQTFAAGYYNYTKKSAHVFEDKTKYDRNRQKRQDKKERKWN